MDTKEALELIQEVIDETVNDLGDSPIVKITAQLAAAKMFNKLTAEE